MKIFKLLSIAVAIVFTSCASISVDSDFDRKVNFQEYKTFAFLKKGIDEVKISDLDKKRILRAIQSSLEAKGMTLSENPDVLVNINTDAKERVEVYNYGFGFGYGWRPWGLGMNQAAVNTTTQGIMYIDILEATKKELIWQGVGRGNISQSMKEKEERIYEFVSKILSQYPPKLNE